MGSPFGGQLRVAYRVGLVSVDLPCGGAGRDRGRLAVGDHPELAVPGHHRSSKLVVRILMLNPVNDRVGAAPSRKLSRFHSDWLRRSGSQQAEDQPEMGAQQMDYLAEAL
jgi:hypothetical protein